MNESTRPNLDWNQIYPHASHRWTMGLRRGDLSAFFAPTKTTAVACAERARWLAEDPQKYTALPSSAEPALAETIALANRLGADIDSALPPRELLLSLGRHWEADFAWLVHDADGRHRLLGGVVCFPSEWALTDKLGKALNEIHAPVPDLNAQLGKQMEAFLAKQLPGEAWERKNLNFTRDNELNHHPSLQRRPQIPAQSIDEFWLRLEHQLLYKLPLTKVVLFGIRIELLKLDHVLEDQESALRLGNFFATISTAAARYKGLEQDRAQLQQAVDHGQGPTWNEQGRE